MQYLYFACFFDIIGYQHSLTHIITLKLHQFEFPFSSFCAWSQHLCTQQVSADSQHCQRIGQNKDTANYWKCLDGQTQLFMTWKVRKQAVQAGNVEFHVFNVMCALTLPRQQQIIKAGVRVWGVSDYLFYVHGIHLFCCSEQHFILRLFRVAVFDHRSDCVKWYCICKCLSWNIYIPLHN